MIPLFNLVCYRREEKPREKVLRKNRLLAECYCAKLKVSRKKLIINELLVEAAGVELITVLTARKLLILGIATTAKKPSLPDPLYVHCTKISSSCSAPTSITGRVSHSFALLRKTICSL
jgi:hypothetical protein